VGCHVDAEFLAEIDRARGGKSRSDFLREAIYNYLRSLGYKVPESLKYAPDRTGKGGRPRKAISSKQSIIAVPTPERRPAKKVARKVAS